MCRCTFYDSIVYPNALLTGFHVHVLELINKGIFLFQFHIDCGVYVMLPEAKRKISLEQLNSWTFFSFCSV